MSGIAGAICLDGSAADAALVERMRAAFAHRGACATIRVDGSARSIAFDGSIHNRAEIASRLAVERHASDAALALAAYERWAEDCPEHLLGDFAFVVWDPTCRSLFCARDIVGVKPFFYAAVDGTFLFASELHALFQHRALDRTPNEGMVAEFLADTFTSREETLFQSVRRLAPAHSLRVRDGTISVRRYWAPSWHAEVERSDADAVEELKGLLRDAVVGRIDGAHTAAQLSGGLDSSTIVAIASTLTDTARMTTYSMAFPGRCFDETRYVSEVVRHLGLRNVAVNVDPWKSEWFARQAEQYLECPIGPTVGVVEGMYAAVRAHGCTSMLTGEGADEWFTGSLQAYADLVERGAVRELALEVVRAPSCTRTLRRVLFAGVWPVLPSQLRRPIRSVASVFMRTGIVPEWLDPVFARRTAAHDRCRRPEYDATTGMSRATWDIAQYLTDGRQALAFEVTDRVAARFGIEDRHPFYDRRVIAFALSLPESQRAARGVRKRVLRNAARNLIPDTVRCRPDKADFSGLYLDLFAASGGEGAYDRLAIAHAGWIHPGIVKREYRRAMESVRRGGNAPALPALWNVLAVDAWYRAAVLGEPLNTVAARAAS